MVVQRGDLYQLALAVGEKDGARLALWAMGQLGPSRAKVDVKLVLDCEAHVEEEQQVVSIIVLLCGGVGRRQVRCEYVAAIGLVRLLPPRTEQTLPPPSGPCAASQRCTEGSSTTFPQCRALHSCHEAVC